MPDRPAILPALLDDLRAEGDDLDRLVADLDAAGWATPTPAEGWTVAHQIAHLNWTDEVALLAVTAPDAFADEVRQAATDPGGFVDAAARDRAGRPPSTLLAEWRTGRRTLLDAIGAMPPGVRAPWYGPPMSAASMATARLMETWAHGQDVADALGVVRRPTARLRHVAHIGVRTRGYGYLTHGKEPPTGEVRIELTGPGGAVWSWGPKDAPARVTGPALDFCLLVTQRRHRDDLALSASGSADEWLDIAQAFAGPPGSGRKPAGAA